MKKNLIKVLSVLVNLLLITATLICFYIVVQGVTGDYIDFRGYRFFYVITGSMEPTIEAGSLIIIKKVDPETLEEGDIIAYISRDPAIYGMVNTHRVVKIYEDEERGGREFTTKGDANNEVDILRVTPGDIQGKVIRYSNSAKWLSIFLVFINTKAGFFVVVLVPVMMFTVFSVRGFVKEFQKAALDAAKAAIEKAEKGDAHDGE